MFIPEKKTVLLLWIFLFLPISCFESEVVSFEGQTGSSGETDATTLLPQIQKVYPGTLQTLDVPMTYPTDIYPDAAHIIVIFSDIMENDNGEMSGWLRLERNGSDQLFSVTPDESSSVFEVIPDQSFSNSGLYSLYISKSAHLDENDAKTPNFAPLVEEPATTINPPGADEVEYTFQTAGSPTQDISPPSLLATNPVDGEANVPVDLSTSDGTIYIIFTDNENPMINPLTFTASTVNLTELGTGSVSATPGMIVSDYNFKTYTLTPDTLPLSNSATYIVRISVGDSIEDMSGNTLQEQVIVFHTVP